MKDFLTAAVFDYPHEIAILRHLLTEAEIPFYFENESIISIAPTLALGGIKLKVHPDDLETVQEILKKLNDRNNLKIV